MWIVIIHGECEDKAASFIHALVRFDRKSKVQDIIGIREGGLHGTAEGQFSEICRRLSVEIASTARLACLSELVAARQ